MERRTAYLRGWVVLGGLAALTAVEYGIAVSSGAVVPLLLVGMLKALLILEYFMHVSRLWAPADQGEH